MSALKSRPVDPRETRRRIEAALVKHERGERLTETEETILYWLRHGGGCHACGAVRVAVAGRDEGVGRAHPGHGTQRRRRRRGPV